MVKRLRILLIAAGFLAVSYFLTEAGPQEGEVFYLSFDQGNGQENPGIPGDGIVISSLPFAGFIVSPLFSFNGVRNGITFSAFFRDTVPGVDVTNIKLDLGLTGRPPVPCGIILGVGSPSPPVLTPPVNGVRGIAISFTQQELEALLAPLQQEPECANLTVDDFYLRNVLFFKGEGFGPVDDLDAFAVGIGTNVFPGKCDTPGNPPSELFVDNTKALGLFEGIVQDVKTNGITSVSLRIQPTQVIFDPLTFGTRGVSLWFSIEPIRFYPSVDIATVTPDLDDPLGGLAAERALVPPDGRASFRVQFCEPGEVRFILVYNVRAASVTLRDAIIPITSLSEAVALGEALLGVPLYNSTVSHLVNAFQSTSFSGLFRELSLAARDLLRLTRNEDQFEQLRTIFRRAGIEILLSDILRAPVRLFEVYIDTVVFMIQAGVPFREVEIALIGR